MNTLLTSLVLQETKIPEDKDVVAGWLGFAVFLLLCVAVGLLCWNLTRQLRKTKAAKDAGVYGDKPVDTTEDSDAGEPRD